MTAPAPSPRGPSPFECESVAAFTYERCGEPGNYARFACVHEHIREGVICPSCERKGTCRECWDHADHACELFRIGGTS